jgi:hypothetical protein
MRMGPLKPFIRRVRRHHAVEHATIHILGAKYPKASLAGRSDRGGFYLYGQVDTEDVRQAVHEALRRLADEPELAVHPMCGTNMVVGGLVAGVLSLVAVATMSEERRSKPLLDALPRLILAGTAASVASQPLGPFVQRWLTTLPDTHGIRLKGIRRMRRGRHVVHRVQLEGA